MEELKSIVERARGGDLEACGEIVRRFQDMSIGYAYALLGDFQLAEDAAQEAFIQAYGDLGQLREPGAFQGWFRRVVFRQCDRVRRRKHVGKVPLESAVDVLSQQSDPSEVAESGSSCRCCGLGTSRRRARFRGTAIG